MNVRRVEAAELRSMTAHLIDLERTLAVNRSRLLVATRLQRSIGRIAASKATAAVISEFLRAISDPLGFSRAIFFESEEEAFIARRGLDGSGLLRFDPPLPFQTGAALHQVRRGVDTFVGTAGELGTPVIDVRGWFVVTALRHGSRTLGMLYADGHPQPEPVRETTALLETTASIASIALDNVLLYEQTRQLAMCDPLTGLLNRRAFGERLEQEIERCGRQDAVVTCVMLDVDDFKAVNDRRGHAQGDVVLKDIAATLRAISRTEDVLCRYAGDEFVVLFVDGPSSAPVGMVGRLSAALQAAGLRCSLGAARYPHDALDAQALLAMADRALYRAKASGKNRFEFA